MKEKIVVVFDAECLLCSGWVRFLLDRDQHNQFQFASMQAAAGKSLLSEAGLNTSAPDTLLVIEGDHSYQNTLAILRILHRLGGLWRLAWLGWLIPSPLRNGAYRYVARHRYAIFGRREKCFLPSQEHANKFLE